MTDRELLELAAKAAGIDCHIDYCDGVAKLVSGGRIWNPLADDGDALRLAVNLSLEIIPLEGGCVDVAQWSNGKVLAQVSECNSDRAFATRRAIVRAAAEIGRAL